MDASSLAIKQKRSVFSSQLLLALEEDLKASDNAPGEIVGLDFDPFLNSQDPAEHYALGKSTLKKSKCSVEMYGVSAGKKNPEPEVVAESKLNAGKWVFVNFHYGKSDHSKDENLLDILKSLNADRKKWAKDTGYNDKGGRKH
ncbi:MAG: hypothetical protein NTY45_08645 [Elusimicrobia bacterium]|nr:hypothetical protein [Elusimicrobiota bacterium]